MVLEQYLLSLILFTYAFHIYLLSYFARFKVLEQKMDSLWKERDLLKAEYDEEYEKMVSLHNDFNKTHEQFNDFCQSLRDKYEKHPDSINFTSGMIDLDRGMLRSLDHLVYKKADILRDQIKVCKACSKRVDDHWDTQLEPIHKSYILFLFLGVPNPTGVEPDYSLKHLVALHREIVSKFFKGGFSK